MYKHIPSMDIWLGSPDSVTASESLEKVQTRKVGNSWCQKIKLQWNVISQHWSLISITACMMEPNWQLWQ